MLFIIGVVVALAGTAHALRHAMLLEKFPAGMTCILHTAITVMNKTNNMRGQRRKHEDEAQAEAARESEAAAQQG